MKVRFIFILFLYACTATYETQDRYHLSFHKDSGSSELLSIVSTAEESVHCVLNDINPGPGLELSDISTSAENEIKNLLSELNTKRDEGLDVSFVLGNRKCTSNGSLFLQYPDKFQNDNFSELTYKDLFNRCQNGELLSASPWSVDYATNSSEVTYNYCIIDSKTVWFSLFPLNYSKEFPNVTLTLNNDPDETSPPGITEIFFYEMSSLKNLISGDLKVQTFEPAEYSLNGSVWKFIFGPQNKPSEYMVDLINQADSVMVFSNEFNSESGNDSIIEQALTSHLDKGKKVKLIFSGKNLFNSNTFVQNNISSKTMFSHLNLLNRQEKGHFFLLENPDKTKKTVFLTGSVNDKKSARQDSLLIEITSEDIFKKVKTFWEELEHESVPVETGFPRPLPGEIAVTELVWMGSIDNFQSRHPSDEAVEFYNNSDRVIDIGQIAVACTNNSGIAASDYFILPQNLPIDPGEYLLIAARSSGAFPEANIVLPELSFLNTNQECIVVDNARPVTAFHPPGSVMGHYNDSRLRGQIIDKVLDYNGDNWNSYSSEFFSRTGLNTLKHSGGPGEGARSMERNTPGSDGSLIQNWHTNSDSVIASQQKPDYIYHTYSTAGQENSPGPATAMPGSIIINEIHWMGSYDNTGLSNPSDEFVEFFNNTDTGQNIGGWMFGCTTGTDGSAGKPAFGIPFETVIAPGEFLVISKTGSSAFWAGSTNMDMNFSLANTITQCILTDSNPFYGNFTGIDANGNGVLEGHYDNYIFYGKVIDTASDRATTLAKSGIGLNNTSAKIRRSGERIDKSLPGDSPLNWKTNSTPDYLSNISVFEIFRSNTFATPGRENSP